MMCAATGLGAGDCQGIYEKCWKKPMIYYRHGALKTYCTKKPSFTGTEADGQKAISDAKRMQGL
jgi:hypothetical protein